jgi:hypothetical protein
VRGLFYGLTETAVNGDRARCFNISSGLNPVSGLALRLNLDASKHAEIVLAD